MRLPAPGAPALPRWHRLRPVRPGPLPALPLGMAMAVVTVRCGHGLVCLLNAGHVLHPLLLDPCESAVVGEGGRDTARDVILTNHYVVRDGSVWKCVHCKRTEPYGKLTDWGETCTPRRWGDQ